MVADAAASKYNVTWSRTTPIVVSVYDDAYFTYITGEMSHRMGMDVFGDPDDVKAFRYACSSSFSPIEHWVMEVLFPGGDGASVTIELGEELISGQMPDIFVSDGYLVMKSEDNTLFLVFDPKTGILRDVMITSMAMSGSYCFSDLQTEWMIESCEQVLTNPPVWLGLIGTIGFSGGNTLLASFRVLGHPAAFVVGFV